MRKFLASILVGLAGFCTLHAQTLPYSTAVVEQVDSNGNHQKVSVTTGTTSVSQNLEVNSNGQVVVDPVTKGNITTSVVASGSAVSLTTATTANVTSVSLAAGTYYVWGTVDLSLSSATMTKQSFGISTTSATLGGQDTAFNGLTGTTTLTATLTQPAPLQVLTLSSTTTVYLVAQATFSAGTVGAYGTLSYVQIK